MATLRIVGCGQTASEHLTLAGCKAILNGDLVFTLHNEELSSILNGKFSNVVFETLDDLYVDSDVDTENYTRIASRIVAALEEFSNVTLVVSGHPRFGVSWYPYISRRSKAKILYIDGISSWDSMMTHLERDPLENGSVVVDVNRFLLFSATPDPTLDLFIFNICSTGNIRTNFVDASEGNAFEVLQEHLLKLYQSDQPVFLLAAGSNEIGDVHIPSTVGSMMELLPKIKFHTSLFVPAVSPIEFNEPFLRRLLSIPKKANA